MDKNAGRRVLSVCEVCGEPKRIAIRFDLPGMPDEKAVGVGCKCDRERQERQRRDDENAETMRRIGLLRGASLMERRLRDATFENFVTQENNAENLSICKRYVERFSEMVEKNQGLLFWGDVGAGKTYAAACIANALLSKGIPVVMTSFIAITDLVQYDTEKTDVIMNRLNSAKLVIFDDLGAERNTSTAVERVYHVVDSRYRCGLPSIFTTNLQMNELTGGSDIGRSRIYDRILETCYPMRFVGLSWRKQKAGRRYFAMRQTLNEQRMASPEERQWRN